MLYPVVVHKDAGSSYGVTVPDLPGCFSAGETLESALAMTSEAIDLYLTDLLEDDEDIPLPLRIEDHVANPEYEGGVWSVINVDMSKYSANMMRIDITLPSYLLKKVDQKVESLGLKGRSDFFVEAALSTLMK